MRKIIRLSWGTALLMMFSTAIVDAAEQSPMMPEIVSEQWLNSAPLSADELRDKVVLVEFWTFACWNCQHVEPYIKQWHNRYKEKGLVIIAVHTPEFTFEHKLNKLRNYMIEHELHYPVAVDNDSRIWRSFHNWAWPTIYLVGKQGRIRYKHVGEGGYKETEGTILRLLNE